MFFCTSCRKERVCLCTYTAASGVTSSENKLSGKYTKKGGEKECNSLDGVYTVGAALEETTIDCNLK